MDINSFRKVIKQMMNGIMVLNSAGKRKLKFFPKTFHLRLTFLKMNVPMKNIHG